MKFGSNVVYLLNLYDQCAIKLRGVDFIGFVGLFSSNYEYAYNIYQKNGIEGDAKGCAWDTVNTYFKTGKSEEMEFDKHIANQLEELRKLSSTLSNDRKVK